MASQEGNHMRGDLIREKPWRVLRGLITRGGNISPGIALGKLLLQVLVLLLVDLDLLQIEKIPSSFCLSLEQSLQFLYK